MALVREAAACSDHFERDVPSGQLSLGVFDAHTHEMGVWRAGEFSSEFAREVKLAQAHHPRKLRQGYVPLQVFVEILVKQATLGVRKPAGAVGFAEDDIRVTPENVDASVVPQRVRIKP